MIAQLSFVILSAVHILLSFIFNHKRFIHLRDSNIQFFKAYSPSVIISSDIKFY